jgi:hypothetical protein
MVQRARVAARDSLFEPIDGLAGFVLCDCDPSQAVRGARVGWISREPYLQCGASLIIAAVTKQVFGSLRVQEGRDEQQDYE